MTDPRALLAARPMHWRQVIAVGLCIAINAVDGFDVLSISFASPGIAQDWGIDRAALGVVLSMELIGMGVGSVLLGGLADHVGRRPTIVGCLLMMAVGMLAAARAGDVDTLSAWRLLTGLGIGGILAAINAMTAEFANARRRALAVTLMAAGFPMGAVVGGSVASALLVDHRWPAVFEFGAAITLAFVPLVLWLLPESIAFLAMKQPRGALARINATLTGFGHPTVATLDPAAPVTGSPGIAGLFAPPLRRRTLLLTLGYSSHVVTFYFIIKWIPKVVTDLGFAPSAAGGVLVWANVGGAAGSLLLGALAAKIGVRPLILGALVGSMVMVVLFGRVGADLGDLTLAVAAAGFFTNAVIVGIYSLIAEAYPTALRAGGTGFVIGFGRAGAALGPIVAGLLFAAGWDLPDVAIAMAGGSAFALLALAALGRTPAAVD